MGLASLGGLRASVRALGAGRYWPVSALRLVRGLAGARSNYRPKPANRTSRERKLSRYCAYCSRR
jgi:hypothetical protein